MSSSWTTIEENHHAAPQARTHSPRRSPPLRFPRAARRLAVSRRTRHQRAPRRSNEIVHGKRAISADTALRLARYFGTSERVWLNLQARFDLETERDRLGKRLEKEVIVLREAS